MKNMFIEMLRNTIDWHVLLNPAGLVDRLTSRRHRGTPSKRTRTPGKANPAGMKMWKRSLKTSKRGCDGTLRR